MDDEYPSPTPGNANTGRDGLRSLVEIATAIYTATTGARVPRTPDRKTRPAQPVHSLENPARTVCGDVEGNGVQRRENALRSVHGDSVE